MSLVITGASLLGEKTGDLYVDDVQVLGLLAQHAGALDDEPTHCVTHWALPSPASRW